MKNMYECAFKTEDWQTKTINLSWANSAAMEMLIKQAAEANGSTAYRGLWEWEILCRFLNKNPDRLDVTNQCLQNQISLQLWAAKNWMEDYIQKSDIQPTSVYIEPKEENKWKARPWIGGYLASNEVRWRMQQWIWRALLNSTRDRTAEDISRAKRFYRYDELPSRYNSMLEDVNAKIAELEPLLDTQYWSQADEELKMLYNQKEAIENRLKEIWETKKNLPSTPLDSTKQTAKEWPRIWGGNEKASQIYNVESDLYFTKEITPYLLASEEKFNIPELISSLTRDEFMATEGQWKKIQEILREEAKAYKKMNNVSLYELEKEAQKFKLSAKALGWESSDSITKNVYDKIHTVLRNKVVQTLEKENPNAEITNRFNTYSNYKILEENAEKKAVAAWKKTPEPITPGWAKNAVKKTTTKAWFRNWLGNYNDIVWKRRRPTTWLYEGAKWLWNKIAPTKAWQWLINLFKSSGKTLHVWDPIWTIQLLELGGDLWDALLEDETYFWMATDALWSVPWVQALDELYEINSMAKEWNALSEEDRVNVVKQLREDKYWFEMSYEDALRNYKELIENPNKYYSPSISA